MLSRTVCGAVLICAFANTVCAEPIDFISSRSVATAVDFTDLDGNEVIANDEVRSESLGNFQAVAEVDLGFLHVLARQSTTLDPANGHFFGSGATSTSVLPGGIPNADVVDRLDAESLVFLEFTLTRPMAYAFSGTLSQSIDDSDPDFRPALARVFLLGLAGHFDWVDLSEFPQLHVAHGGVLPPGSYRFVTHATSFPAPFVGNAADAAFAFDFRLGEAAATPEPASLVLVSTCLIGTAARFCRRGRPRRA